MDAATAAVVIAGMSLAATIFTNLFGSGWKVSGRLTSIETQHEATQLSLEESRKDTQNRLDTIQDEMKKIGEVLVNLADIRGDYRVMNTRVTNVEQRVTANEKHIDELRRGVGWIQGGRPSVDGEY